MDMQQQAGAAIELTASESENSSDLQSHTDEDVTQSPAIKPSSNSINFAKNTLDFKRPPKMGFRSNQSLTLR